MNSRAFLSATFCSFLALYSAPIHSGFLEDLKKELEKVQRGLEKLNKPPEQSSDSRPETSPAESPQSAEQPVLESEQQPLQSAPFPINDKASIREAQYLLSVLGYDPGPADGISGPRTTNAIRMYQRDSGAQVVDGILTDQLLASMRSKASVAKTASTTKKTLSESDMPIVLTIDGIDRKMTPPLQGLTGLAADGRAMSYLKEPVLRTWNFVSRVEYVPWDGIVEVNPETLQDVKIHILQLSTIAKNQERPLAILAHSWGSVLTYRALAELRMSGDIEDGDIGALITIGSPLNSQNVAYRAWARSASGWNSYGGVSAIGNSVKIWQNYWAEKDNVSGSISALGENDQEIPYAGTVEKPHDVYYKASGVLNHIGENLEQALATSSKTVVATGEIAKTVDVAATQPTLSSTEIQYPFGKGPCLFDICIGDTPAALVNFDWSHFQIASPSRHQLPSWRYMVGLSDIEWKLITRQGDLVRKHAMWKTLNAERPSPFQRALGILAKAKVICAPVNVFVRDHPKNLSVTLQSVINREGGYQGLIVVKIERSYEFHPRQIQEWTSKVKERFPESIDHSGPVDGVSYSALATGPKARGTLTAMDRKIAAVYYVQTIKEDQVAEFVLHPECPRTDISID